MDLLIVDDDPAIRRMLSLLFSRAGVQHLVAMDAADALMICRKYQPRLVISDVDMPDIDGITLAPQLRQAAQGVEVWAFTGSSGDAYMKTSSDVFNRVFSKYEHSRLVHEVSRYLAPPVSNVA
jgi:CheY-like chemotaxis protein